VNNEKDCETKLIADGLREIHQNVTMGTRLQQVMQAAIELVERKGHDLQQTQELMELRDKRDAFIDQLLEAAGIDGQDYDNAPQILKSQMAQLQGQAQLLHKIGHAVGVLAGQDVSLAMIRVGELVAENETLNARIMHIRDQLGINYASVGDVRLESDKIGMLCAERDNLEGIVQKLRKRSGETPENSAGIAPAAALEMLGRALDIIDRLTMPTYSCEPAVNLAEWEAPRHG
jgi:hypothetical protein